MRAELNIKVSLADIPLMSILSYLVFFLFL